MKDEPIAELIKEKHGMQDCCYDNIDTPKSVGHLRLVCPVCGLDITLAVVLYSDAAQEEPKE